MPVIRISRVAEVPDGYTMLMRTIEDETASYPWLLLPV